MIKKNYKIMFLVFLVAAGFYLAQTAGQAAVTHHRKGLPEEMVISAGELRKMQLKKTNFVLLDARSEQSYQEAHIQGAILPLTAEYYEQEKAYKKGMSGREPDSDKALKENMKKYSKDTPIVTYCSSGGCQASAVLALQIKRLGFQNVKAMEDGIQTWDKKGYPVVLGETEKT